MIKLRQCTKTFGDCTAGYEVTMNKVYSVKELIEEVISDTGEWGYIGIENEGDPWFSNGNPNCEYRYGKLLSHIPEEYMDKEILSATASGGWSRMDYKLTIIE